MKRNAELTRWLFEIGSHFKSHFHAIFVFGFVVNVLLLVSPLYMLQIYDRVLSSGSFDPLLWLTLIAVFLLGIYAAAEAARRRLAALAAQAIETHFAARMFARFEQGLDTNTDLMGDAQRLSRLTAVFQNGAVLAFFDLPFVPLFMIVLFMLNPILGLVGLGGAGLVFVLAVRAEAATRKTGQLAAAGTAMALNFASGLVRQRSAMIAMGIVPRAYGRWASLREKAAEYTLLATDGEGRYSGVSKSIRQILQILVLAAGAGLALAQAISPGAIVAASILVARALAPIDQITGGWRQLVQARAAWAELDERLNNVSANEVFTPLPRPSSTLSIQRLAITIPETVEPLVRPFTYEIPAGRKVAVVGANGAGKTALLQTLAGVWTPKSGSVALGGRNLHSWPSEDRGQFIGYVPQDIELVPATVGDNIARLQPGMLAAVISAAYKAGAHETILGLPDGYDTVVGPGGVRLSAGQTQLIGLARAMFGDPALLLLDEPTANLDAESAAHVISALNSIAAAGVTVVTATHDGRLIKAFDTVLSIRRGAVDASPASDYTAAAERRLSLISRSGIPT